MMNMELVEPRPEQFPNALATYIAATRPPFILATVMPVILGLAWVAHQGLAIHWLNAVISLLAAVLLHGSVNVLNDYYDALNGTDEINEDRVFPFTGGSRFIQNEVLSKQQMLTFGLSMMAAVLVLGLYLAWHSGSGLFWLGLTGVLIGWGYSAPPLQLNSRGLGEPCVLTGFGLLPLGAWYVQTGGFSLDVVLVSLPVGLLTANLLYINQFPDRKADIQAGKMHWVARLEPVQARWIYLLIALLAWCALLALIYAGILPSLALLALLPAVMSLQAARILLRDYGEPTRLAPAIRLTILSMLAHGFLLSVALFLS